MKQDNAMVVDTNNVQYRTAAVNQDLAQQTSVTVQDLFLTLEEL